VQFGVVLVIQERVFMMKDRFLCYRMERDFMSIFTGLFRSRDKPKNSYDSPSYSYFFGRTNSGKRVNDRTAMQHTAVYACVRVLSEAIAQLPLHVYQYTDKGKERVPQHPLYFLLHDQPNPEMTSFVFRETLMSHLLIYGNAYAQIIRNGRGDVIGLYPLMPDKVKVDRDEHNRLIYIYSRYDEANPNLKSQGDIVLRSEDVLHIPGLGYDGLVGYSPIAMAKNAIGLAIACDEYGATFFANGASPSGVLEHPGVIKNPERVRDAWQRAYGSGNAHRTCVLEEGMKYTPISIPNNEAQFLETRKFQIEEIARLYRVPLHMIGDLDHATFSNVEHLSLDFVKYSLDPWIVRWEQGLQKALLSDNEKGKYFVKFNVDGLLRGDYASRMQGYSVGIQNGFLCPNDVREFENMNLIPDEKGGFTYMVNGSMTPLEAAGAAYSKNESEENK
jgi:HK97 family phage portal protein